MAVRVPARWRSLPLLALSRLPLLLLLHHLLPLGGLLLLLLGLYLLTLHHLLALVHLLALGLLLLLLHLHALLLAVLLDLLTLHHLLLLGLALLAPGGLLLLHLHALLLAGLLDLKPLLLALQGIGIRAASRRLAGRFAIGVGRLPSDALGAVRLETRPGHSIVPRTPLAGAVAERLVEGGTQLRSFGFGGGAGRLPALDPFPAQGGAVGGIGVAAPGSGSGGVHRIGAGHDGRWRLSGRARSCRPPGARGRAVRRRRRTGACSRPASARAKPSGPAARRAGLGRSMRGAGGRCGDRSVFRRGRPAAGRGGRGEGRRRWGRRHDGRRGATGRAAAPPGAARAAAPRPAAPPMRAAAEGPRGRSMTRRLISLITTVLWMFR